MGASDKRCGCWSSSFASQYLSSIFFLPRREMLRGARRRFAHFLANWREANGKKNRARKGAKCLSHKKRFANKASPLISTTGEFDFASLRPFVSPFNQLGRSADDNIFPGKTKQKTLLISLLVQNRPIFLTTVN